MRRTFLVGLIALSSGILLSAAGRPAPVTACSLLSKDDAAAALGEAAKGPKATGPINDGAGSTVSACEYAGSGIHRVQLNLTYPPVSLGDLACWYDDKHEELHVIKGNAFLSMELRRSGSPTEAIIAVMKKALAKLK